MTGMIVPIAFAAIAVVALFLWGKARRREQARVALFGDQGRSVGDLSLLRSGFSGLAALRRTGRGRAILFAAISAALFILTRNFFLAASIWPAYAALRRLMDGRRRSKSLGATEEQALEFIDSLNQSLRSGLSLLQALESSREDIGPELGAEVASVLHDVSLGAGLEESLARAADRTPSSSLHLTFTILALLHGKGGDLPRVLERLRKRVQEGLEVKREARMLTSQSRASGYLVASLPFAFLLLQGVLNPRSLKPLLATPIGNIMVAAALALNAGAFLIIRKLINQGA